MFIPVSQPYISPLMKKLSMEAVDSGWISSLGEFQKRFSSSLESFYSPYLALTCSSGTTALHLALEALGIGDGDSVIVPDISFVATVNAVLYSNASPIIVPVDQLNGTIDLDLLPRFITEQVKAVVVTHLYGISCDMQKLSEICQSHGIFLVEDCAESFGSFSDPTCEQLLGTFGHASCFSFYGNKTVTTGEGGAVLFRDQSHFDRASLLRDHGMSPSQRYFHLMKGYNYRMTNIQAALGFAQLEEFSVIKEHRLLLQQHYLNYSSDSSFSISPSESHILPWLINISTSDHINDPIYYNSLSLYLKSHGIDSRPLFRPFHTFDYLSTYSLDPSIYHSSFTFCNSAISLPTYIGLTEDNIKYICHTLLGFTHV
jgi:perosamine synthetase